MKRPLIVLLGLFTAFSFNAQGQCSSSLPFDLFDVNGYEWDIMQNGTVSNGTIDAYDVGMSVQVDGTYFPVVGIPTTELLGRQLVYGPAVMSGLNVSRKVYVPSAASDGWARWLEIYENPTSAPITVSLIYESNPGSDSRTSVDATFNGNTIFEAADHWVITDDFSGGGDPTNSYNIFNATNAAVVPNNVSNTVYSCAGTQGTRWDYSMTIPAGETYVIMTFLAQNQDLTNATATATFLDSRPAEAWFGLQGPELSPVNWGPAIGGTAPIPTVSEWGLIFLFLGLITAGSAFMLIRRKRALMAA